MNYYIIKIVFLASFHEKFIGFSTDSYFLQYIDTNSASAGTATMDIKHAMIIYSRRRAIEVRNALKNYYDSEGLLGDVMINIEGVKSKIKVTSGI